MIGKPAVTRIEQAHHSRQMRGAVERPGPPDLSREIDNSCSAAVDLAFGRGDAHFAEQVRRRQIKQRLRARILQGREAKAARFERTLKAAGQAGADAAVAVEENPGARGAASFCISYF